MDDQNKQPCVLCKMCQLVSRYWKSVALILAVGLLVWIAVLHMHPPACICRKSAAPTTQPTWQPVVKASLEVSQGNLELYEKLLTDKETNLNRWLTFIAVVFTLLAIIPAFLVYLANQAKSEAVKKADEVRKEAEVIARELNDMRRHDDFRFAAQQAGLLTTQKDYAGAIRLWSEIINTPEVPSNWQAQSLYNRAVIYGIRNQAGDVGRELADYTAVIAMSDVSMAKKAMALLNRGVVYTQRRQGDDLRRAIADYTTVIGVSEAPIEQRIMALCNRAVCYDGMDEVQRAIDDYTAVIDTPVALAEYKGTSLFCRGGLYRRRGLDGDVQLAINDYATVIRTPDVPVEQKADARLQRGSVHSESGDAGRAIADYTAVVDMPDAPVKQKVRALIDRGLVYFTRKQDGDQQLAIDDYTTVIGMPDASMQHALALFNRGSTYVAGSDWQRAIDDFTKAIAMPTASPEIRTRALCNRGLACLDRNQDGDVQLAIDDYNAVIAMPDAPVAEKAMALFNLACLYAREDKKEQCKAALERAKEMELVDPRKKYEDDKDFVTVRDDAWFIAFLDSLDA